MDEISSIETLGAKLKSVREAQGLLVENISRETRIARAILINLEDDNISDLPPKIYVIGFVKTYARILKISEDECLLLLDQLYKNHEGITPQEEDNIILNSQKSESTAPKNLLLLFIPVAIIGALILYFMFSSASDSHQQDSSTIEQLDDHDSKLTSTLIEKKTPAPEIENAITTESIKASEKAPLKKIAAVENKPEKKTVEAVKEQDKKEKVTKKEESKTAKIEEKKEEKKKEIRFINFPKTLYTIDQQSAEEAVLSIPKKYVEQYNPELQNLYIRSLKGNSWITYQLDKKKIHKYVLKEGKEMFLQAKLIRMFVGNINSIEIFLNNLKIKTSSKSGVKSLVFPQERAQDFKIPLFIFQKNGSVISSEDYIQQLKSREPIQSTEKETSN